MNKILLKIFTCSALSLFPLMSMCSQPAKKVNLAATALARKQAVEAKKAATQIARAQANAKRQLDLQINKQKMKECQALRKARAQKKALEEQQLLTFQRDQAAKAVQQPQPAFTCYRCYHKTGSLYCGCKEPMSHSEWNHEADKYNK